MVEILRFSIARMVRLMTYVIIQGKNTNSWSIMFASRAHGPSVGLQFNMHSLKRNLGLKT